MFAELRDFQGDCLQLVARNEETSNFLRSAQIEDSVCLTGTVVPSRPKKGESLQNKWDLLLSKCQLLNRSNVVASQLDSLKSSPQQYPPEYRYLQLRLPFYQKSLKQRAAIASIARETLQDSSFTEVETPLLFKSTPEGAREFLVPTRAKSKFYALPQSPQQYKQLLMASGMKNYYQIAKCFRDEDLRADRQPEFTQIDMEMAFASGSDVRRVTEKVVKRIWKGVRKLPLYKPQGDNALVEMTLDEPLPKLTYEEALSKYGIDKPDLRNTLQIINLTPYVRRTLQNDNFPVFEVCILRNALNSGKFQSSLNEAKNYVSRTPMVVPIKDDSYVTAWRDFFKDMVEFEPTQWESLQKVLDLKPGDVIAGSTRATFPYENPTPMGRFRQLAAAAYPEKWNRATYNSSGEVIMPDPKDVFVASWVVDFPLFSPLEVGTDPLKFPIYDTQKYVSTHHPFTMAHLDDYHLLEGQPLRVRGEHYDLVVNGVELGGGSRRIHDSELQNYIFKEILKIKEPEVLFGHLLKAFNTGCPPHAGIALGFDRLCAMLINSASIRDVIAFPKNQSGVDPVVESPTSVNNDTLENYYIEVV